MLAFSLLLMLCVLLQAGEVSTHKAILSTGAQCIFLPLDVTVDEEWQTAVAAAVERFGRIDV